MGTSVSDGRTALGHAESAAGAIRSRVPAGQPTLDGALPLPTRQARWTRLGIAMGYTDTPGKRAAICTAVDSMVWVDPDQLADILDTAPLRFVVAGLFSGRAWQLYSAATTPLPGSAGLTTVGPDGARRLIGLQSVTGDRYLLLDLGYEVIDLLHDTVIRKDHR